MKFFPKITYRWQSLYNIYRIKSVDRYVPLILGQRKPTLSTAAYTITYFGHYYEVIRHRL